ncbi:MAG TPA: hypothetical protein VFM33_13900 [Aquabacterium sp.]|nr:hypothetical protein [Aquabacterium sp.]
MTKDEFIKGYAERSRATVAEVMTGMVALPCDCGDDHCQGWAMVSNTPRAIKSHMDLYAPASYANTGDMFEQEGDDDGSGS